MLAGQCSVIEREFAGRVSTDNDFISLEQINLALVRSLDDMQFVTGHPDS
jgi:hypothetical protein